MDALCRWARARKFDVGDVKKMWEEAHEVSDCVWCGGAQVCCMFVCLSHSLTHSCYSSSS